MLLLLNLSSETRGLRAAWLTIYFLEVIFKRFRSALFQCLKLEILGNAIWIMTKIRVYLPKCIIMVKVADQFIQFQFHFNVAAAIEAQWMRQIPWKKPIRKAGHDAREQRKSTKSYEQYILADILAYKEYLDWCNIGGLQTSDNMLEWLTLMIASVWLVLLFHRRLGCKNQYILWSLRIKQSFCNRVL